MLGLTAPEKATIEGSVDDLAAVATAKHPENRDKKRGKVLADTSEKIRQRFY